MLLYGQVIDVAGDGRWCWRIGCKGWMIDVPVVQYFGLTACLSIWSQVFVLVRAGAGLQLVLAVAPSSRSICQEGVVRRPNVVSEDFLGLALGRAVLNVMAAVIGLVCYAGSAAVVGWIPRLLLRLVVRTQTPRSAARFGG